VHKSGFGPATAVIMQMNDPTSKNGLVRSMLNVLETLNWIMFALSNAIRYLNDFNVRLPCDCRDGTTATVGPHLADMAGSLRGSIQS